MDHILLNKELDVTYPDGFHVLDEEERKNMNIFGEGEFEVLSDPEKHIVISIGWKPVRGLFTRFIRTRDLAVDMEARLKKPMKQFGYKLEGFKFKMLDGDKAEGYCYRYTASGIPMYGESFVVKHFNVVYYLYLYSGMENKKQNLEIWDKIFSNAKWK